MEKYDCIVVGGGIIGACCAYELIRAGAGKIAWLEQSQLASGTSRAYAGNIFMAASGYIPEFGIEEHELETYGLDFYNNLNHEEPELELRTVGSLFLGLTEQSLLDLSKAFTNDLSVPGQEILDPQAVSQLCRGIESTKIGGAVYHPESGWVSARRATHLLGRMIQAENATVMTNTPVEDLLIENGNISGVLTATGKIGADNVVLATGAWTNSLLEKRGIVLPMIPVVAARVVAKEPALSVHTPVILIKEKGLYLREEDSGILWGGSFVAPPRFELLQSPPPADLSTFPLDGVLELIDKASSLKDIVSFFTELNRISFNYGAPCHTRDRRAMVGPISEVRGLYFAGGCNEAGVIHAPGFGRLVAESVLGREGFVSNRQVFAPDRYGLKHDKSDLLKLSSILFNFPA